MHRLVIMLLMALGLPLLTNVRAAPLPRDVRTEPPVEPSAARLLFDKRVRKELKLTTEQVTAVVAEMRTLASARMKRLAALPKAGAFVADPLAGLAAEHAEALRKSTADLARTVLTAEQRTRLGQIDRRLRGPAAFADAQVQTELQLSEAQRTALSETARNYRSEEARYLSGAVDGDDGKLRDELLALRQETLREMEGALTPAQRTAWQTLLGATVSAFDPADFALLRLVNTAHNP